VSKTTIAWVARPGTIPETTNPTTGCDRESAGCKNCYALAFAARLKAMGAAGYQNDGSELVGKFGPMSGPGFGLTLHPDRIDIPRRWKKPRTVFLDSMSDLFHPKVPLDFIQRVFSMMEERSQHTFMVLTKRATRLVRLAPNLPWPSNVWMGVSVEDQSQVERRARRLLEVPAAVRWLSVEPMLEGIDLSSMLWEPDRIGPDTIVRKPREAIRWVVAGGESGDEARPCDLGWFRDLRDDCRMAGVAYFQKQMGQVWARQVGARDRKGEAIDEWPEDLRIREWPEVAA
jgi:protein gp37